MAFLTSIGVVLLTKVLFAQEHKASLRAGGPRIYWHNRCHYHLGASRLRKRAR
jgi:hypothetical protein